MKQTLILRMLMLILTLALSTGCSDQDNGLGEKTDLLTHSPWWNTEVIGSTPTGFTVVSPLVFWPDQTGAIGGYPVTWKFIENGSSIQIIYSTGWEKYKIIDLSETEFHCKLYNSAGDLLVELRYDHCNDLSLGGC